jgi:transglutaminase-like putative cysteine protease
MKIHLVHETKYEFNSKVFFEPHYLRFKPRNSPQIKLENFNLEIYPVPTGISEHIDAENNLVHLCWFDGVFDKMKIKSEFLLESLEYNPFNFIIYPGDYLNIPFQYEKEFIEILHPALKLEPVDKPLIEFSEKIVHDSNSATIDFLTNLTKQIHSSFTIENREIGKPFDAKKTFRLKKGSCRDLAWMQIILLRHVGFAARFVSGYYFLDIKNADFELHAWVEVFLPGAGWIGFDPSHGIIAGNTHIPIASSAKSEFTMPVSGTIRGDADSIMKTKLNIENIV